MEFPDWYPDWRHEAVHELQEKNARLAARLKLDTWPQYDFDVDKGTLIFSEGGVAKVIAEIQVAGTTSANAGNWLWAWANSSWPPHATIDSGLVRDFGDEHGICELTHDFVDGDHLNALGWELTAVTARITGAVGAYRPPRDEGGGLFVIYRNIGWAS